MAMPAPTWITFVTVHQALPGRRMRPSEGASHVWTVAGKGRDLSLRPCIVFTDGTTLPVARVKRQRWQIEVYP